MANERGWYEMMLVHSLALYALNCLILQVIQCEPAPTVATKVLLVRVALFLDSSMRHHLSDYLEMKTPQAVRNFNLAYVSQMDAILKNLATRGEFRLEVQLVEQDLTLPEQVDRSNGDVDQILSDFCIYQASTRAANSTSSWNIGILLTANDLYSSQETSSNSLMGISPVGGIAWPDLSCLITEFGVGHLDDEPGQLRNSIHPTRGFASAWTAAHELAHNLGIHHDGLPFNADCSSSNYIMAPDSQLGSLATEWSECSKSSLEQLLDQTLKDSLHQTACNRLEEPSRHNLPGQMFDINHQCRFYSRSLMAPQIYSSSICNETIWCQSVKDGQRIAVGPALEGTSCSSLHNSRPSICAGLRCVEQT